MYAHNPSGIGAIIILGDDELLPEGLNKECNMVFRQGDSTCRQLKIIKPLGALFENDHLTNQDKSDEVKE